MSKFIGNLYLVKIADVSKSLADNNSFLFLETS